MQIEFLFKGLLIGFIITTPFGPVGVVCIRRILTEGRLVGFVSGLGAAVADALFGALAAIGVTFMAGILVRGQFWFHLSAGVIILAIGLKIFFSRPALAATAPKLMGLAGDFLSVFFLALSNPVVILTLAAVMATLGLASGEGGAISIAFLVFGIFLGSVLWWIILTFIHGVLKLKFSYLELRWINRISGLTITAFGLLVLLSLVLARI